MKLSVKISFLFLLIFSAVLAAQDNHSKADSASHTAVTLYNLSGDNLFLPGGTMFPDFNLSGINDSSTIWMRTRMAIMNRGFGAEENPVNVSGMLHPYLNFYNESKNISLLRKVLGMAQLGAVGYLAYKHIKKYGLFHSP